MAHSKIYNREEPQVMQNTTKSISNYIKYSHRLTLSGIFATFSLCLFSLLTIFPLVSPEQKTEAATGTASTTSLTLSTTGGASLDLAVNNSDGTFNETTATTGQAQFTVTTTNYTGYTLSIQNSSSSTDLTATGTGTSGTGTSTIASIPTGSSLTSAQFNNATYNGKWGYKPSKLNSQPNSNYIPSPTTTATTLNITNCANGQSNGSNTCPDAVDSYTIDLAARLQYTQDAGNYTNTFIITAVANKIDYQITYADESSTSSDIPSAEDDETDLTYITLSSTIPTREGYTFQGWCTTSTGADGTNPCTGTTYQPGDQYPINQTTQNLATLYAMWKKDIIAMQDMPDSQCTTDAQTIATDTRDGKTYTVQRLADGKCWMTSNLNLAGGTALTADDTNMASDYTMPTANGFQSGNKLPASSTSGFSSETMANVYNTTGSYGGYYTWTAATLGSGLSITADNTDALYSICPKGWRLPISRTTSATNWQTTSDFYALAHQYGLDSTTSTNENDNGFYTQAGPGTTPNFLPAGFYYSGSSDRVGSIGYYWSATSYSSTSARYLFFSSSGVDSAGNYGRNRGLSVRCVKMGDFENNDPLGMLEAGNATMQDIGELSSAGLVALMNGMTNGRQYSVKDVRDNKIYTIAKINGALWMTQNLRYIGDAGSTSGSMTIKSATTNINADKTLTYYSLDSSDSSYTNHCDSSNGYTYPCAKAGKDDNNNDTVWYNYAATSAGTITGDPNTTNATQDICPKGWKLPPFSGGTGSIYSIASSLYKDAFSPVYGGYYVGGSLRNASTYGYWWSATTFTNTNRYLLGYYSGSLNTSSSNNRYVGLYVRCVRVRTS